MDKIYNPQSVEDHWLSYWLDNKLTESKVDKSKKPYTIVIPPPNVTGILHMGHALNNTIQDILIRYKRMKGFNALWMVGTDHAGIATQNVVERKLLKENQTKDSLGREAFIRQVWDWKEDHGSTIIKQLKKLGASCDWSRERFTMDEGLSLAVREVFIKLYAKGYIHKKKAYLVNWCPRCKTALSDEEAEHRDIQGQLYYIKYPAGDDPSKHVTIATTRPETMLGDVAIAVNPKDKRYISLHNKSVLLPILNKEIPVICDEEVKMDFGTGALKITPAHDPVDYEVGVRHNLERVDVMDDSGVITGEAGEHPFIGMDRFECRESIIDLLKEKKLFVKSEEHQHAVGHCYRCHTIVEPRLSSQWFVKMKELALPAIEKVKNKDIVFYPDRWTKVYLNWMNNIHDWCISRQIWWGHQIPVWYDDDGNEYVARDESEALTLASKKRGKDVPLKQDSDVLDTWFSSWLWPFSTLGWPDENEDLDYYYPTDTLATAPEIIFFWVARMIMAGCEFKNDIPFRDVYIHGTVRDDTGVKMSKSLGNTIDPLEIIDEFGADALRYSLISITAQGQDVFLSKEKFHIGRNFANKIWNASRFLLSNIDNMDIPRFDGRLSDNHTAADKWIIFSLEEAIKGVETALLDYKFNDAAHIIYDFIWHKYCDWYIEIVKRDFSNKQNLSVALYVLQRALELLHPIMPFITEDIWQRLPGKKEVSIMITKWPTPQSDSGNKHDLKHHQCAFEEYLFDIVAAIRNMTHQYNLPKNTKLNIDISCKDKSLANDYFKIIMPYLEKLIPATIAVHEGKIEKPDLSAVIVREKFDVYVRLEGLIDFGKEKERIKKEMNNLTSYIKSLESKLNNQNFCSKAPPDLVNAEKEKLASAETKLSDLEMNLANLCPETK